MVSILGVSGLELYSSGSEPVTIFGAQSWIGGHNFRLGGTIPVCDAQAGIWRRTAPESSPRGAGPVTAYLAIFF